RQGGGGCGRRRPAGGWPPPGGGGGADERAEARGGDRHGGGRAIDAEPATTEALGGRERGAATTEEVGFHLARLGAGGDDAPQQRLGFLRRVAQPLRVALLQVVDVQPDVRR